MRRPLAAAAAFALAVLAFALPSAASARTVNLYAYSGNYISGTGSAAGTFLDIADVDLNTTEGKVLVLDRGRIGGSVSQFSLNGTPVPFTGLATNSISKLNDDAVLSLSIDNSDGPSEGNFYIDNGGNSVLGFSGGGLKLGPPFPLSGFQNSCENAVDPDGDIWVTDPNQGAVFEFSPLGVATGRIVRSFRPCQLAIDGQGNLYLGQQLRGEESDQHVSKYSPDGTFLYDVNGVRQQGIAVDPSDNSVFIVEQTNPMRITHYAADGSPLSSFGQPDPAHSFLGIEGGGVRMAVDPNTHNVYVAHARDYGPGGGGGQNLVEHVDIFKQDTTVIVPTVTTDLPGLTPGSATLKGTVDLDGGGDTTACFFEWGPTNQYGNTLPCNPGSITEPGVHQVTAELPGLVQGTKYNYRLVAKNSNEVVAAGINRPFRPQGPALVEDETVANVLSDGVKFESHIDANGGDTTYHFEYGPADCAVSACASTPARQLQSPLGVQLASEVISGLTPDTGYHFRVVADNAFGTTDGLDYEFATYPKTSAIDECANAPVRKQTGAGLLLDCRAYELATPTNAGGYDVVSDLVPGQQPLDARPRIDGQVLFSLNFGKVPGVEGNPTNLGNDPYLARRGANGWTTSYAGIPATGIPSDKPFGSPVLDSSSAFDTVVFGGANICGPCFDDDSVGIPVRLPNGNVVQGMAGSLDPGPGAEPDGYVPKRLSADGSHLIFGSASKFEADGNGNGDVSVYSRNLASGETEVVSKAPGGANLACLGGAGSCHAPGDPHGIGALAVSADGTRVVVAQRVSTDGEGNDRWHPYMHIEGTSSTIDLAPGTVDGALFAGMNDAGTIVYLVSTDKLTADDTDTSADLFRASVGAGTATLTRVSTGTSGAGNSDGCDPVAGAFGDDWNSIGGSTDCSVVAIAGGGGASANGGAVYFLSPEQLAGPSAGVAGEPNLYVARSGGSPQFVATLGAGNQLIDNALSRSETRSSADFQVSPDGEFAVFSSAKALTGFTQFGHSAIFRSSPSGIDCVSCAPTGAGLTGDTRLSSHGLNLADDGRVFYTSPEQLVLRDTAGRLDVYEWRDGRIELISGGISPTDAGLVTAGDDGRDVFFFTRETHSALDRNGATMKVYDARQDGGFLTAPTRVPCQASDECHGAGTIAAPPPAVGTFKGTGGNAKETKKRKSVRCRRGFAKKNGRCVKKRKRRHQRAAKRRRR